MKCLAKSPNYRFYAKYTKLFYIFLL